MFEIKNEDALFRLSFIERLEEIEDRRQDLIMCWLEIEEPCISLHCKCELSLFDLEDFRNKLSRFYESILANIKPVPFSFIPRIETFTCECLQVEGGDYIGFNFTASPHQDDGWTLKGGIAIDQSYLPGLISGIESILTN
jgi:hypothetical protein